MRSTKHSARQAIDWEFGAGQVTDMTYMMSKEGGSAKCLY